MNKRSLLFLLICSTLFNLFFIAGAMMGWEETDRSHSTPYETRLKRIVAMLELNPEQQAAFELLHAEYKDEAELLEDRMREIRTALSIELDREQPDLAAVDALMLEETRLRTEQRRAGSLRFEEFIQHLDADQRKLLGNKLRQRGEHSRRDPLHRMLDEFDRNGNGILDEDERRDAEAMLEQRKQDHRARRAELHKQFDVDGDGELSPEEQRALHEFKKQQRDRPGRPQGPGRGRGGTGTPESP